MRKLKKIIFLSVALTSWLTTPVFARDVERYNEMKNTYVESSLLPSTEVVAYDLEQGTMRSQALATAMSEITNKGNGVIGVFAETTMHTPVDWAYLTVYLERWYEDLNAWQIELTYEREFCSEDEEGGILTSATFFTDISNQPTGYYYRVRTIHELEFDDGWYEAKVTKTDGILITSTP